VNVSEQSYSNHKQYVPLFHGVLFGVLVLTLIGAGVNLYKSFGDHERLYSAALIFVLAICTLMLFFFARIFALKAQDRAIRAEENLRHFVLTGKLLDPRLSIRQIIGLRFASDSEYLVLAKRAVDENLSEDAIKRAVKSWRADTYRA
jgi:Family of unknown function (DUF6526)